MLSNTLASFFNRPYLEEGTGEPAGFLTRSKGKKWTKKLNYTIKWKEIP
jgi:hypothetical protein